MYSEEQLKAEKLKLLAKLEAELPEPKDPEFESSLKLIGWHEQYVEGHNQVVDDVKTAVNKLRLEL